MPRSSIATRPAVTPPKGAVGHMGRHVDFERECAQFFGEIVQIFGVPKSVGQIYGVLYASPEPLSFSDIVERLDISKGSMSQGLHLLRTLGAINIANPLGAESQIGPVRSVPGLFASFGTDSAPQVVLRASRGVAYVPELSLRKLVSGVLQERVGPMAAVGAERLKRLRELAERETGKSDFSVDRVRQLETWRRRLKAVLPMLTTLLGPKRKK